MPPLALANLNFLGREHPSIQNLSLATKRLLGKGCLCLKQLFLGQGESAEVEKGLMISQPQMTPEQILPSLTNLLDSLCVIHCNSGDEVKACKGLRVSRLEYLQCLRSRKRVCEAFADVTVDDECLDLPLDGVPDALLQSAMSVSVHQCRCGSVRIP